ncbi:MAG: thioredoxin fold domain-containing protein [Gammaproteobacteria bacterium]|nr:thioredoxin fold domain-containing protein [Gammaproteobacteria bacterium]
MAPKKFISLWLFALLLVANAIQASTPRDPYEYFFEQFLGDLTEELEIAADEGKQGLFIFFEMDECPFCHRMKRTVLNQPDIQDYFKEKFHSIAIDVEGDVEMVDFQGNEMTLKDFASKNRVRATPVMAIYDLEGNQVVRYTGAASGTDEFIWLAEYYLLGIYKMKDKNGRNIRFSKYKRLKKKQQDIN